MKKILIWSAFISLFFSGLSVAQTAPLAAGYKEQTISLGKLSGIKSSITLTGKDSGHTFYLPIPAQWDVREIKLQLSLKKSSLLVPPSTLSLSVNNTPIQSIRLDQSNDQSFLWQITIPKQLINKKNLAVQLDGYLVLTSDICQDVQNKANWLLVNENSKISYFYQEKPFALSFDNLKDLFIQKNSISADKIGFIFPQEPSALTLAPVMQLSQYFSRLASWRGVKYSFPKSLNEAAGLKGNIVVIAKAADFDFSFLKDQFPLTLYEKQWKNDKGKPLAAGEGFLFLTKNPANTSQNLLVISSNDEQGLVTAVSQLMLRDFKLILKKSRFLVAKKAYSPEVVSQPVKKEISLKQLGYADQIVYGSGQRNLDYQFYLPVEYSAQPVEFTVYFSHSPFLSKEDTSSLALILNGTPINGIELKPKNNKTRAVRFTLPEQYLQVGENSITFRFYLKLMKVSCSREEQNESWGIIYNSSYFNLKSSEQISGRRLSVFPSYLDGIVNIGLPVEQSFYQSDDFVRQLILFAASLKESRYLYVSGNDKLSPEEKNNIIYIGGARQKNVYIDFLSSKIKKLAKKISQSNSKAFQSINVDVLTHLFDKKDLNIGLGFLLPKLDDSHHSMLLLVGNNANELNQVLALMSSKEHAMLNGDIAIAYADGTFTTLVSEDIKKALVKEVLIKKTGDRVLSFLLFGLLALVVFILIIILLKKAVRND